MNDKTVLKKLKNLPDNPAKIDSPVFTGEPTVPTATIYDSSEQIANVQYVSDKMKAKTNTIDDKIDDINSKMDRLNDMDMEKLEEEIKNEISTNIGSDVLASLSNEVVKISFADVFVKENSTISLIDGICDIIDNCDTIVALKLQTQKMNLYTTKSKLSSVYDTMKSSYDSCISGETSYTDFNREFVTWYTTMCAADVYCRTTLQDINMAVLDRKVTATQDDVFAILTNDGECKALYIGYDDNGNKQIMINGEYVNLRGSKVTDDNGNVNFGVNSDGSIVINTNQFSINNKTIESVIEETISSSDVMTSAINTATVEIKSKVTSLENKIDRVEANMNNISSVIKDSIKDDIVIESEKSSLTTLYYDIRSRYNATITEINTVLSFNSIEKENKTSLENYKNNVTNAFNDVLTNYNNIQARATNESFTLFNDSVTVYNNYVGVANAYCRTVQNNINKRISDNKLDADRQSIINVLTDDGIDNTIILDDDNRIIVNGEHVKTLDFRSDNSITTKYLNAQNIYSNSIVDKLSNFTEIIVNQESGNDYNCLTSKTYKSLQNVINVLPDFIENEVVIVLKSNIIENIDIRNKIGGHINIYLNGFDILGTLNIEDCSTSIQLYPTGVYGSTDNIVPANKPSIRPYELIHINNAYCTIHISNSSNVKFNNINIYGQYMNYSKDSKINVRQLYCAYVENGSRVVFEDSVVCDAYNGICSDSVSQVTLLNNLGYVESFGTVVYGGGSSTVIGTYICNGSGEWSSNANEEGVIIDCTKEFDQPGRDYTDPGKINKVTPSINSARIRTNNVINVYQKDDDIVYSRMGAIYKSSSDRTCFLFGNSLYDFVGKNIQSIKIILNRTFSGDYNKNAYVNIRYHDYKTIDEFDKLINNKQFPLVSNWSKTITFKGINNSLTNMEQEFVITDTDILIAIEQGLISGINISMSTNSPCDFAVFDNITLVINYKNYI